MCGIAGFYFPQLSSEVNAARLEVMLAAISHRGPDGEGVHVEPNGVGIGMRRLSILDLEGGWQPIWNEDRSVAVVFNGEIYNYIELRAELIAKGHNFATNSDTEVLVHLYEDFGHAMLEKLRGMFTFAIYDRRRAQLFLARDHFGQKPLYYWSEGGSFAFASELKSLLTLPEVDRDLAPDKFLDYISWFSLPTSATHFRSIKKLTAGSSILIDLARPGCASPQTYWRYQLNDEPDLLEIDEASREVERAFEQSIGLHLRSDVPVGVLLSGGLDSRMIGEFARSAQSSPLSTFSVGFDCGESELEAAAATARELGTKHYTRTVSAEEFADNLKRVAWHLDEPIGDPAAAAVLLVCEMAREHVTVLLSGEGADELFGGYASRYQGMLDTMQRTQRLRGYAGFVPRFDPREKSSRLLRLSDRVHMSTAAEAVSLRIEGLPGDVRNPRGLTPDQRKRLSHRQAELGEQLFRNQRDGLSELLIHDIEWQLAESLLQKADKMSMAASIELRTPFLDRGMAEVAARVASPLKLGADGVGKVVLRHCMNRRLPDHALRPKKGFPVPLTEWFRGPLRRRVEEEALGPNAQWRSHLDGALIARAWCAFQEGEWNGASVFYALWIYEKWHGAIVRW
ncbi:asparagine synthase (glutamine-hydrolyzing) [Erythromicrobium ramosum]|uniref:asparagine synthase (glutamine-hydrolyzing) n=1 Tax=Erythrobacter ramosus TaxID=35811 RepID=A0A6I4ULX0_9SPHN|nr:asparagine synthase (glutamine-hydrolyzing) [Erythrobacter ramosus]MBB3777217.1 asparagine synthase (glutamine-hydrolyzing) [Erythrobacter ramosus]MXP39950.1 asparagine synthase (glutamine-hydrolyzing) [Erythrobacter ramosus]